MKSTRRLTCTHLILGLLGIVFVILAIWAGSVRRQIHTMVRDFQRDLTLSKQNALAPADVARPDALAVFQRLVTAYDPSASSIRVVDELFGMVDVEISTPTSLFHVSVAREEASGSVQVISAHQIHAGAPEQTHGPHP